VRVYLTNSDLSCEAGRQLLELASRIAQDGKLDLEEIKELRLTQLQPQQPPHAAALPARSAPT